MKILSVLILTLVFKCATGQNYYVVDDEFSTSNTLNRGKIVDFFVEGDGDLVIMSDMINANSSAQSFCRINSQGNLVDNLADGWQPGVQSYLDGMLIYGSSFIAHVDDQNNLHDYYDYVYNGPPYGHPSSQIHDAQILPDKSFLAGGWINVDSVSPGAPGSFRCMLKLDSTGMAVPGYPEFECIAPEAFPYIATYIFSLDTTSTGNIIAAGTFVSINGVESNHLARISQDGEVDPTFSTPLADAGAARVLLVDSQDRIWFVPLDGATLQEFEDTPKLIRLLPDGELDESYNHPFLFEDRIMLPPMESYPSGVTELPDGTFIITGFMYEADGYACKTITHIDDSGNIIDDFWMQTGPSEAVWGEYVKDHYTSDVKITEDGKIYIAGQFSEFNGFETSSIVRLKPSGLNTENKDVKDSFDVFPNPAKDIVNINHPQTDNGNFQITDIRGKIMTQGSLTAEFTQISVDGLSDGIYLIRLEDNGSFLGSEKIIVQH